MSTDLTSLNEGEDRAAVVIEMTVAADGAIGANRIYPCAGAQSRAAHVQRRGSVAGGQGGDAGQGGRVGADWQAQLQLQDEAAHLLRAARDRLGALTFDRAELQPVVDDGNVRSVEGAAGEYARRT